jgi:hypothetical protein
LVAPAGTENGAGQFGASVALSGDANTALIGGNVDSGSVGAAWVFVMPPTVSNVSPPSGPAGGGTAVTITGTALDGATAVAFAGAPATSFSVVSNTEIDAVSPPGDPAPVDIRVTTPAGSSALGAADRFTYFPSAPGAPTSVHATAGNKRATVTFAAPRSNGSGIVGYTVAASPGGAHASADGSPVTVTGLRNGTRYTFTVTAKNGIGPGPASAPSNAVTPTLPPHASHVSIKGVGKRKPKLSFTISAGKSAPPVKSIAVKLPKGLRFSGSKHSLAHGTNVRGSKPLKFTAKVKRGVLTITLKRPGSKARVTISPPALATTASLAAKVRLHKAGKVSFAFTVTDGAHTKTKLTSKDKIS